MAAATTSPLDMDALVKPMLKVHRSRVNFSYKWRMEQLDKLGKMITEHREEWVEALGLDLGKSKAECDITEVALGLGEIKYIKKHLKNWMKERHVPGPVATAPCFTKVKPMPRNGPGVLVISPFNYPLFLIAAAVAGSFSAGNPTVCKPSEISGHTSALLAQLVPEYFSPGAFQVVLGGVEETTALLEQEWGLIHFTGSVRVGKVVSIAAAKTLTPVILELGGKCPVYVDEKLPLDLNLVAHRIVWAKRMNTGQTCVAPDYLVIHEKALDKLVPHLCNAMNSQFGEDPEKTNMGSMVAKSHTQRGIDMLKEVEEMARTDSDISFIGGGSARCNLDTLHVSPTLVLNAPMECRLMKEEIFTAILPIRVVKNKEEAMDLIADMPGTPLSLYVFTRSEAVYQEVIERCRSGSAVRNDCVMQLMGAGTPFGGLGTSGNGKYRGPHSFEAFSHMLTTLYRPCFPGSDLAMFRYEPIGPLKLKAFLLALDLPYIPILHTRKVLSMLGLGLAACFIPAASMNAMRNELADVFTHLSKLIKV